MKKQGFTLIELMVVVVIIGILAAVAVPKLFGMIAKSKASEVGPAAGTYVKMQQAYVSEANKIGGWQLIGYTAPGKKDATSGETNNFTYSSSMNASDTSSSTADNAWKAANLAKLNDCEKSTDDAPNWSVNVSIDDNGADSYETKANGDDCEALTPTFAKIGEGASDKTGGS